MSHDEKSPEFLLEEAERRLRELQRIANVGSWEWNVGTNEVWWSEQIFSIFGVEITGEPYRYEDFLEAVHPDDRKAVQDAVEEALEGNVPYDIIHRITRPDGKIRYLRELAEITRDENGTPLKMTGTVQDITERHVAEKALQMSEGRLATIIDIAPEAVVATDLDGRIQIFNRGAEDIFGYTADEVKGQPLDILIPPPVRRTHRVHVRQFENSGEQRRLMGARREVSGYRKDGTVFPAYASVSKVELEDEAIFIAIMRDVSEAYKAEAELRKALEDANTANLAKSQFLAIMSHELRTPLNAILGFAEILSHEFLGPLGNSKYSEYAEDIFNSGELLLSLVNDLLDFSAAEQGTRAFERDWVDLERITMESVRVLHEKARSQGVNVVVSALNDTSRVFADERAIKQILLNVLSNAIKFTPVGGEITVTCDTSHETPSITVRDTGIGIPKEAIPSLTEPFKQIDTNPYHTGKGWGLGLAIAKSLVDLHGGSLEIDSVVGKGTQVRVRLPQAVSES